MPKKIIFCADGTWNGPGSDDFSDKHANWTNVFKLFSNLAGRNAIGDLRLADEQERSLLDGNGATVQIAKYIHGVGDSGNFLVKFLGGTTGAGIITRIVRGYTFISRNYEAGDQIILTGFSRGAYTARALGGLITARGLLDAEGDRLQDKERAYQLGAAVWYDYRKTALGQRDRSLVGVLEDFVNVLPSFLSKPPTAVMVPDVPIEAIAVWDTVGSLGIPFYVQREVRADLFRFADTKLNSKVAHGIHAIAVDEQRGDFVPTFWDPDDRIRQCLFPGAHADVGGGYILDESGLSDAALVWMQEQLAALGIRFAVPPAFPGTIDLGIAAHRPWDVLPFNQFPVSPRKFPVTQKLGLSKGLIERLRLLQAYDPVNLADYLNGRVAGPGVTVY